MWRLTFTETRRAVPWRAAVWTPVIAVIGLILFLAVPALPGLSPTTRPVEPGERVAASTASFAPAAGWTLDLDAATSARPTVTLGSVTVRFSDGVWFGSSSDLLKRMRELLEESGASVGPLPHAPSDDALISLDPERTSPETIPRAEYLIDFTSGDAEGHLLVVREDSGVALVRVVGPAADISAAADDIDSMFASVDVGVVSVDTVPQEPR